jgi:flagellar biosynthesis/type III secretory pathway protein FliH
LSAIEHGQCADIPLAARVASTAIVASADIDAERSRMYLDLILISLAEHAPEAFEATMNSLKYEYKSDFARHYFAQGRAEGKAEGRVEGKAEGRVEIVFKLLTSRFGPLSEGVQDRVHSAQDTQIDALAERVLTAQTLEEALSSLS